MKCPKCGEKMKYIPPRDCTCPGFERHRETCPQYRDMKNCNWEYFYHRPFCRVTLGGGAGMGG